MAQYFETLSSAGQSLVMIDDTFRNLALTATGVATSSVQYGNFEARSADIAVSGHDPVIAVQSTLPAALATKRWNGSQWVFTVVTATGGSFRYFIYDRPDQVAPQYLVIRNAQGEVVFNGAQKYLRVVTPLNDYVDLAPGRSYALLLGNSTANGQRVSGYIGAAPAPVLTQTYVYMRGGRIANSAAGTPAAAVSNMTLFQNFVRDDSPNAQPVPNYGYGSLTANILVVDVTNFI